MVIQDISIQRLYDKINYEIKFFDNCIIIVSGNGAGKTTLLRLIYFFISKQWAKLSEYDFESISATIDGMTYEFKPNEYLSREVSPKKYKELAVKYSNYQRFIIEDFSKIDLTSLKRNIFLIDDIETKYDVPKTLIITLIDEIETSMFDDLKYAWDGNIIYLPTYRRVEQDYFALYGDINNRISSKVATLFPSIDAQIRNEKAEGSANYSETEEDLKSLFSEIINSRNNDRWLKKNTSEALEMIEFGMDDINFRVQQFIESKENNDVKIDEYCELINKYLGPDKSLKFDYDSNIFYAQDGTTNEIYSLNVLSSGEKQLISIFSHLYFEDRTPFLIIDEPEISLSLSWQEILINDIKNSSSGFVIATHSPFVITEDMQYLAVGVNELIK